MGAFVRSLGWSLAVIVAGVLWSACGSPPQAPPESSAAGSSQASGGQANAGSGGRAGAASGGSAGSGTSAAGGTAAGGAPATGGAGAAATGGDGVAGQSASGGTTSGIGGTGTGGDAGSGGGATGGAGAGPGGSAGSGDAGAAGTAPGNCGLPNPVSFKANVEPFLTRSCGKGNGSGCHVTDNMSTMASGGFDHAYDWITAGSHASSCPEVPNPKRFEVVLAVLDAANPASCSRSGKMPPQGTGTPLTACERAALEAWLALPKVSQTHRADDSSPTTPYLMPPYN